MPFAPDFTNMTPRATGQNGIDARAHTVVGSYDTVCGLCEPCHLFHTRHCSRTFSHSSLDLQLHTELVTRIPHRRSAPSSVSVSCKISLTDISGRYGSGSAVLLILFM